MNKLVRSSTAGFGWLALSIVTALLLLISCIVALRSGQPGEVILQMETKSLSDGWTDREKNQVILPAKLPNEEIGTIILERELTAEDNVYGSDSILFSAKYLNVRIYLDEEELGKCLCRPDGWEKTSGKTYFLAPLPEDIAGKRLRIEAEPLLGARAKYEVVAPRIGYGGQLVHNLIREELPILATISLIFAFGILLFLFGFQARKSHNTTLLPTGIFAVLFSLYSVSITDTVHLFIPNSYIIYLLEFLLLAVLPLPLLVLVYHICIPQFKRLLLVSTVAVFMNVCLQLLIQFFSHYELRDSVILTHILMGVSVVILLPVLALSSRQGKDKSRLLLSFSPVLFGALWDLCRFYLPSTYQKAIGFQLGVLLFLLMQSVYLIRSYFEYYKTHLETNVYRHMAYTDALTGLRNRAAFEERILELDRDRQLYQTVYCMCADINNLKKINDTMGHAAGDELIRGAAQVLKEMMQGSLDLYRIGGDEFVLFFVNHPEDQLKQTRAQVDDILARFNQQDRPLLSLAVGYDRLEPGSEDTIPKLLSRADALMYEDKRLSKEKSIL